MSRADSSTNSYHLSTTASCFFHYVWILECLFFFLFFFVNEVIYSYCFPFLCKYIYFWCEVNIWIVNVCTECVVGMYSASDRNVSEGWIMGGSHFFIYIGSYIIFVYLSVCCYYWFFVGWRPQLFTSFVLLLLSSVSSSRRTVHAAILNNPTFRCQDSKACHRRFNAKSNVHSMNNIQAPETFWSVFVTESVLALSKCAAVWLAGKDVLQSRLIPSTEAVFFSQTSELCLFLCNRGYKQRERNYQLITVLGSKYGL